MLFFGGEKRGSCKSAMEDEVMDTETLQLLLKGMPNKFDILDPDGDDKNDEIDMGKSSIEEEHMPSDSMNPSDRGEDSVLVGSSKSVMDQEVTSPETEDSMSEEAVEEAEEVEEEIWQIRLHIALLGIEEQFTKEAALLAGRYSTSGKSSMREQAEDEPEMKSEMQRQAEEDDMIDYFIRCHFQKALKQFFAMKYEAAERKALVAEAEKRKALLASQEKSARREKAKANAKAKAKANAKAKAKAKAKANAKAKAGESANEARKAEAFVTQSGRPEEPMAEAGKAEEAVAEAGNRQKVMGKETSQQLFKDMPNKFAMDPDGNDERDEIDKGESAIEVEHMLIDWKNLSDIGEVSVTVGSGKSVIVQEVISAEMENSVIEAEEALEEAEGALLVRMDSTGGVSKEMADEAERFASHSRLWEYKWRRSCGFFEDPTVMSSMQFTHYTPGRIPNSYECSALETLQIISIKITRLAGDLEFPLSVYGVVAVRDMVDRNRNILFCRAMSNAQEVEQNDSFLHLIGPSRAIVFMEEVCIEVILRVKGGAYPQGKVLISCARSYKGGNGPRVSTILFENCLCTLELCVEPVKHTAQATILSVQVASDDDDSWPLQYGGLVACSPRSGKYVCGDGEITRRIKSRSSEIVLIESKGEAMPKGEDGHVLLQRQVVSVRLEGRLDFSIKAYSKSGDIAAETLVHFYPKACNVSQKRCSLGNAGVTITVAWSRVVADKAALVSELMGESFS